MRNSALDVSGLAAGWLLLLGCVHTPRVLDRAPPEARLIQIEANQPGANGSKQSPRGLPLGDPKTGLRAGDDFALTLDLNAPGHLYVVRSGASGAVQLYPEIGATGAPWPAGRLRVPSGAAWLHVESLDSSDLLCVVSSQSALALADLSCLTSEDGERGEDRASPPPQRSKETTREPPPPPKDTRRPDLLHVLLLPIQRNP